MQILRSDQFDDIYFSPEDGLAETQHTFLKGNGLPEAFTGRERFTIVETGFGTGLNFLAAVQSFVEHADQGAQLDYISFEKYPLDVATIRNVLAQWGDELGAENIDALCDLYPLRVTAFHRIQFAGNIRLTLIFDDVNIALPELMIPHGVDAWFLDGFAPSKNPDMWSEVLYQNMNRLSHSRTTAATFTAAGHVRRGLESAGFAVEKVSGFGKKREMVTAKFQGDGRRDDVTRKPKNAAVIGAGLAGTACAYTLRKNGLDVTVFEAGSCIAAGASGNDVGLFNPRVSAERSGDSDFYAAAFSGLYKLASECAEQVDANLCGTLHLITSEDKEKRFSSTVEQWGWHDDHMKIVHAEKAQQIASVPIDVEALYLPDSGSVSPKKLCEFYAAECDVRLNVQDVRIEKLDVGWLVNGEAYDVLILACGYGCKSFGITNWLPIHTVRGQVTYVDAVQETEGLKCNLCYSGYIAAPKNGQHVVGSSFQKWLTHTDIIPDDHDDNLKKLSDAVPSLSSLKDKGHEAKGWAGLRTSSRDRFPLIGRAPDYQAWLDGQPSNHDNLYISTAHGSHGVVSTFAGAKLITDMILGLPYSLPQRSVDALSPDRFLKRAAKKGHLKGGRI